MEWCSSSRRTEALCLPYAESKTRPAFGIEIADEANAPRSPVYTSTRSLSSQDLAYKPSVGMWTALRNMLVTLIMCLVLQALGGVAMMGLEREAEKTRLHDFSTHYTAIVNSMAMNDVNVSSDWRDREHVDMNNLLKVLESGSACHIPHEDDIKWSFAGGSFFSMTLFTTIGYGNFVPLTQEGRAFTCVYTMVGIIAFGYFIKAFGMWANVVIFEIRRKIYEFLNKDATELQPLSFKQKLAAGSIISIIWIAFHAAWATLEASGVQKTTSGVIDAVYFSIITLTTVGLGDITPKIEEGMFGAYVTVLAETVWIMAGLGVIAWFLDIVGEESARRLQEANQRLAHSNDITEELNARLAVRLVANVLKGWLGPGLVACTWYELRLNYLKETKATKGHEGMANRITDSIRQSFSEA